MDLRHIVKPARPAYVEDVDELTGEAIRDTSTYVKPSTSIAFDRALRDAELSTYFAHDRKLRDDGTPIVELEHDRIKHEKNQDVANWSEVANDGGNTEKERVHVNVVENAGGRSQAYSYRWDRAHSPDFESITANSYQINPDFPPLNLDMFPEVTKQPRTEDDRLKNEKNQAAADWSEVVSDGDNIVDPFYQDLKDLTGTSGSDFYEGWGEGPVVEPLSPLPPQGTKQPRTEDNHTNIHQPTQKESSTAAMLRFERNARDIETASLAATDGSQSPLSVTLSEEIISTDSPNKRRDSPGRDEEYDIKCVCFSKDELDILKCRRCDTWQHSYCYYHGRDIPDEHFCTECIEFLGLKYSPHPGFKLPGFRSLELSNANDPYSGQADDRASTDTEMIQKLTKFIPSTFHAPQHSLRDEILLQPAAMGNMDRGYGEFPNADISYSAQSDNQGLSNIMTELQIEDSAKSKSIAEETIQGDNIPLQPPVETYTDSGYASNTTRPAKPLQMHTQLNQAGSVSADDSVTQEPMDYEDEAKSIYSNASSLPILRKTGYMNELADELAQAIQPYQISGDILERIFEVLPELLKAFALSFGHPLSNGMQRDVMVFIHRYRREIVTTFKDHLLAEDGETQNSLSKDKMSLDDIMNLWDRSGEPAENEESSNPGYDEIEDPNIMEIEDEVDEIDENELPGLEAYKSLIRDAPGYNWLLDNLRKECVLAPAEPNVIGEIRNTILKALPSSSKISRRKPAEPFNMIFMVDWDPNKFLRDEEYAEEPEYAIERVITLTCSTSTAQALTCGQYLRQTWPSTGNQMLELVKSLVSSERKASVVCSDGTTLTASSQQPHTPGSPSICIDTRGTAASIAEIGEQLAWLASAVRSSPYAQEVAYSRPYVDGIQIGHVTYEATPKVMYMCKIGVKMHQGEPVTEMTNGQCWHNLFGSPVVVEGFPTLRRPEEHTSGIEIPLNIMAALSQTRRVHSFAGKTLMKGFADMLIPTKYSQGMVTWHLVHSKKGERISYLESENFPKVDIQITELEKSRHILGWCPEMKTYAGAVDACYNVKNSRLPRPSDHGALVDALLSSGHFVMGGTPFSIGRKDIRLRRNSYIMKIKWVSQKFVVLWDVGEERGWLVNGASALLHLVRGSLAQDQLDSRFGSLCSFRSADFQEALKLHQTDAALEVILNQNNLQVKMYSEDEGNVRFKDYVEDFYDLLEKMIDYQFKAVGTGHDASRIPRSLLEGWDFNDLTTGRDPVYPRQALLHQDGLSWVDFTRSVHAITLFGRGFGEIIQPARVSCSSWTKLPQGRSYLAAGVTDLHNIMESDGDPYSTPVKLTHDVLWYTTDEKFAQCRCKTDATPCDLAHILLPSRLHREMTASRSRLPKKGGAVIFGSNSVHKWFWGDLGDPSKTPSESNCLSSSSSSLGNAINDPQSDSGIGRSLSYSASGLAGSVSDPYDEYSGSTHAGISESEYYQPSNHTKSHLSRYSSPVARRYQVGIVCALHLELMAVRVLFDETHEKVAISDDDPNYYALGSIAGHNIVAVCLPHGLYGTNVAADVTSNMKRSFPTLKFCLLVGIGAGVPSPKNDIRLGDVVISTPKGGYSGVLPYDMIKSSDSGVSELNGYLCPPPSHLMCAISELESDPSLSSTPLQESLNQIHECKEEYKHPGTIHDQLFGSLYVHKDSHDTCDHCDPHHEIKRPPRLSTHPKLHYGLIASGNQVMKSAQIRDRLSKEHNVLCFEMEGAGIMNNFPCLIIRGICDYADSHKNKRWQNYAAAVAAAYAKLLLSRLKDSNNRVDGGLAESTSDYRQRSRKRPPSVESTEEHLTKRGRGEND